MKEFHPEPDFDNKESFPFSGPAHSLSFWVFSDFYIVVILPFSVLASSSDSSRYIYVALTDWDRIIFSICWLCFWHLSNWCSSSLHPLLLVVSLFFALSVLAPAFDLFKLYLIGCHASYQSTTSLTYCFLGFDTQIFWFGQQYFDLFKKSGLLLVVSWHRL